MKETKEKEKFRIKIKLEQIIEGEVVDPITLFSIVWTTVNDQEAIDSSFWLSVGTFEEFLNTELGITLFEEETPEEAIKRLDEEEEDFNDEDEEEEDFNDEDEEEDFNDEDEEEEEWREELEDIDEFFSFEQQINMAERGIQLTTAKKYKIATNKYPIKNGVPSKTFLDWVKIHDFEDLKYMETD